MHNAGDKTDAQSKMLATLNNLPTKSHLPAHGRKQRMRKTIKLSATGQRIYIDHKLLNRLPYTNQEPGSSPQGLSRCQR